MSMKRLEVGLGGSHDHPVLNNAPVIKEFVLYILYIENMIYITYMPTLWHDAPSLFFHSKLYTNLKLIQK